MRLCACETLSNRAEDAAKWERNGERGGFTRRRDGAKEKERFAQRRGGAGREEDRVGSREDAKARRRKAEEAGAAGNPFFSSRLRGFA